MAKALTIDLFCEDAGHEAFARALVARVARDEGLPAPTLTARSARGGHGKAVTELRTWQRMLRAGVNDAGDALLVLIDGNGEGWAQMRDQIEGALDRALFPYVAIGCPDPHVEVWCAADPGALQRVLETTLPARPRKAGRGVWKKWLRDALTEAGHVILSDPMDISAELVPEMDLYLACRQDASLKAVIDDIRIFLARPHPA